MVLLPWQSVWHQAFLAASFGAQMQNPIFVTGVIAIVSRVLLKENLAALGFFLTSAVAGAWSTSGAPPGQNYLLCAAQAVIIYLLGMPNHSLGFPTSTLLVLGDLWFATGIPVSLIMFPSLLYGGIYHGQYSGGGQDEETSLIIHLSYVTLVAGLALKVIRIATARGTAVAPANHEDEQQHADDGEHERGQS